MERWLQLLRLGDPGFTLPAAAGLTAWLLASRAWRMAFWWSLLFAAAIGLAGATKIAFLGWGGGWQVMDYKALSGHATGASALFPVLFTLLLQRCGAPVRALAILAGLGLGALVAAALVAGAEHSWAEALAGWCAGAAASLGALRLAGALPPLRPLSGMLAFVLVFAAAAWLMQWVHLGYWMIKVARLLSGNDHMFNLHSD